MHLIGPNLSTVRGILAQPTRRATIFGSFVAVPPVQLLPGGVCDAEG